MATSSSALPLWIKLWFLVTIPIVIWDATFILFRPQSLPGGDFHHIWAPYATYIQIDKRYGDVNDGFVIAQSWVNLLEVVVALWGLFLASGKKTQLLIFASALMTFSKTLIYFLCEFVTGLEYTKESFVNDPKSFLLLFVLPSSFWLVIPFFISLSVGSSLTAAVPASGDGKQKKKN
eukprot:TRINITY_DN4251_c0_g1_i1.p1 TRINITY_DN4251_c0_g1~~TRINITY_DN4251_c0_g1_i1.p1  ORF type:complete len:205 (-),score=99.75 TRINITY_DN4251_c0_g1_i1:42-572(-)